MANTFIDVTLFGENVKKEIEAGNIGVAMPCTPTTEAVKTPTETGFLKKPTAVSSKISPVQATLMQNTSNAILGRAVHDFIFYNEMGHKPLGNNHLFCLAVGCAAGEKPFSVDDIYTAITSAFDNPVSLRTIQDAVPQLADAGLLEPVAIKSSNGARRKKRGRRPAFYVVSQRGRAAFVSAVHAMSASADQPPPPMEKAA